MPEFVPVRTGLSEGGDGYWRAAAATLAKMMLLRGVILSRK